MARLCLNTGTDVNTLTNKRQTPIIFAAMNGHVQMVEFLLSVGADPQICGVFLVVKQFHFFRTDVYFDSFRFVLNELESIAYCSKSWKC
jgi:ankyrin repeat protein